MTADQIRSAQPALAALLRSFRPCFKRAASLDHRQWYVVGLITDLKRKSVEPIALAAGAAVRARARLYEREIDARPSTTGGGR